MTRWLLRRYLLQFGCEAYATYQVHDRIIDQGKGKEIDLKGAGG